MKLFFYALREYDEKGFLEECAAKYDFEYGYSDLCPGIGGGLYDYDDAHRVPEDSLYHEEI